MKKVLIGIALVFAVAGGILFYKNHIANNPGDALLQYMSYLEEADYEKMYEMLDEKSQEGITKREFIERNQNIYKGISMKDLEVKITSKKREKHVAYQVKMNTCAGTVSYNTVTVFVREQGRYRMNWDDSVIFPELGGEDKVRVRTVSAKRGTIYDKEGNMLAGEGNMYSVGIVPKKMEKNTVEKAAEVLNLSKKEIEKKLAQKWVKEDSFVPVQKLVQYPKELLEIPGIMVSNDTSRIYPLGKAAAHLIGYIQEGKGKTGLEKLYDKQLGGKDGKQIYIQNEKGELKKSLITRAETDGEDLHLTIDRKLQEELYHQYQNDKSCHAAMNPNTGEILALVSTPSYDSQAFVWGMTDRQWKIISDDKRNPMQNRWKGTWCPGSSFKPVTGAIGLTRKAFRASEDFGDSGTAWQKDKSWGGYKVTTLHNYSGHHLTNALIYSDNIYFAKAALKIGADQMEQSLDKLGFGTEVPFPFGMTESSYGGEDKIATEIQLADSGYGQGKILVNPVHMSSIYSAFSNDGTMMKPQLVKKQNTQKEVWISDAFSKEAVKTIKAAMKQVIENPNGTGHGGKISGLAISGKTGTAEIKASKDDTKGTELGWFVTITEKNQRTGPVQIVSMVEDVKNRGGSGYVVAKTKKVLENYMQEK